MSLIIKKNTTFKIPRTPFLPSSLGGLSLWLKSDAGVTTFRNTYISQIILSGGTSSILNKTFVASGTPDPNNYYSYSFGENNGYFITYSQDDTPSYNLRYIAQGTGNIIILNSTDGISWSLVYNMPNTITISGITGTHSSANRTYNLYSYDGDNGFFYFNASGSDYFISTGDGSGAPSTNWFLYKVDPNSPYPFLISTGPLKSSAPSGSWTNNLSSGSPSSTYIGVANGTLPTGSVTTSEYGDFLVTAWADQSNNGNNATPFSDNPIYNTSDLNSKPTISLTSMSDYIERVFSISINPLGASGSTAFSVQYVEDVCGSGDDNGPIFGNFGGSEDTYVSAQTHYPYGLDCNVYDAFATRLRKNEITPPVTITNVWTLYSVKSTNNDWQSFVNGQLMYSDPTNTYSNSIGGDETLYIGKQNAAGTFNLKGKVAEVIVYNRVLTTIERQQVEAYLNQKYQIY